MNWLNIEVKFLHGPEYIGSAPEERGTWLSLMGYCTEQENSGRIKGAATWKDRQFQQIAGVTLREVRASNRLVIVDGADFVLVGYSIEKQEEVQAKRVQAKAAIRRRWDKVFPPASDTPPDTSRNTPRTTPSNTRPDTPRNTEGEGEGEREGEREGIINTCAKPVPGVAAPSPSDKPKAPRPRNIIFDALARATGSDPDQLTKRAATACGTAAAEIRKVCPDVTPEEIQRRANNYRSHFQGAACTPSAMASQWAKCQHAATGELFSPPARINIVTPE
jgi:hypothetical protein